MPTWKKVVVSGSAISQLNNDANYLATLGDSVISSSAQIGADISGSFVSASNALGTRIDNVSSTITLAADNGSNDTYTTGETLTFTGDNSISTTVSDNEITIALADGVVSSSAQVVSLVESGTDSNTFTDADHSKLNAIEASATADQTDAEIRTAVEAATDSNVFTDADHSKLNAIEASATADQTNDEIKAAVEAASDSNTFTDADHTKLDGITAAATPTNTANVRSAGAVMDDELTNEAAVKAINQGLSTSDNVTFANTTVTGNLTISGTTTTVNSETLNIDDNIIALNGNGAALGGIAVNDGPATGSLLWNGTDNRWVAGATGSESAVLTALGYGILSGSTQIAADISGSFVSASNALGTRIDNVASTITLAADSGTNDTYTTGETLTFEGDNSITTTVSDNKISFAIGDGIVSSSAQAVALVEAGTDSNTFTDADHSKLNAIEASATADQTGGEIKTALFAESDTNNLTDTLKSKLDGIETSATADQTDAEIRAAVEAATDSNVFTDADHSKLNAIEALADVTDTANVRSVGAVMDDELAEIATVKALTAAGISGSITATSASIASDVATNTAKLTANTSNVRSAGAVMDDELTSIADVKALNQSLVTGASPTFVGLTLSGNLTVSGTTTTVNSNTLDIGDNIIALNGVGSNLGGIAVNDGPATGSLLWNGTDNRWVAGATGSESAVLTANGYGILSGSAQVVAAVEAGTDSNTFTDADHSKLDAIEASATADQTDAEIRAAVEAATDSNVFTDADHSKLNAIEASATADQTDAEIRTAVEAATDSNVFTDADHSKLNAIEASATADQTDAEIRTAVEAASDSNVFTDADHSKLNAIEALADVTDNTNVTAAGALMDTELAEIATVKALTAAGISGSFVSASNALGVRIDGISTDFDDITNKPTLISGSSISSPSQGTARLAVNGVNTDADLGLQAGDSPTFASLTLTGNLTVTGDRIEQQVTNLAVEDQFITINSGASAQDAGIFFEGQGASFGWDESENRFALDFTGGNASQTTITSDAYVAAVAVADDDANYQKDGNLFVNDSGEAFIYVSS